MEKEENRKTLQARKKVICDLVKDPIYVPMKEKELAALLQVAKEDREELRTVLRELLDEGKLTLTAKGKYVKSNGRFLTGTFISNAKGFGFVRLDGTDQGDSIGRGSFAGQGKSAGQGRSAGQGQSADQERPAGKGQSMAQGRPAGQERSAAQGYFGEQDLYIPEDQTNGAFHQDRVEVALLPEQEGRRREAKVVRIIARGITRVVGTYDGSREHYGFVVPDNARFSKDIFVPKERSIDRKSVV